MRLGCNFQLLLFLSLELVLTLLKAPRLHVQLVEQDLTDFEIKSPLPLAATPIPIRYTTTAIKKSYCGVIIPQII